MNSYSTRVATGADDGFLWEMLYLAIYVPPSTRPPPREILGLPGVARYLDGWGRAGDLGFIAFDVRDETPVGAAWMRLWTEGDHGYGFVDTETPELIVAVDEAHRGEGVGTLLLRRLLSEAASRFHAVSLSVDIRNQGDASV